MGAPEDAGTIFAQIRLELTQMEKDGLKADQIMDNLAQKFKTQGEKGGKVYVQGFGSQQIALNKKLNNMVSSLGNVSPKLGSIGNKMASAFSKPIFAMVPAVSMAFQAMLPVIGTILVAVTALMKGILAAAKKQKEFNDNVKVSKEVSAKLKGETIELTAAQQKSADINKKQETNTAAMRLAFQKLGDFLKGSFLPVVNAVRSAFAALGSAVAWILDKLGIVSAAEAAAAVEAQTLSEVNRNLISTMNDYEAQLKNIAIAESSGAKTAEEAARARLSAMEGYIDSLIQARNEAARLTSEEGNRVRELDEQIALLVQEHDILAAQVDVSGDALKIEQARKDAIEKYEQAVQKALDAEKAGLIDKIELEKQLEAARANHYGDLEAIAVQYRNATGEAREQLDITKELRDTTAERVKLEQDAVAALENQKKISEILTAQSDTLEGQEIARQRAIASSAKTEIERNVALNEAIRLENELIKKQRERELDALKQSKEYIAASENEKEEILKNFDEITNGMMKMNAAVKGQSAITDYLSDIGKAAWDAYSSISNSMLEISRQVAEEEMAIIDEVLEHKLDAIEKERKAALIAAGFEVANNAASLEQQLEDMIRTGDEVLIYQAQRRLEEQRINDEFDEQAKAAAEEAAKEKAEIEYKLAMEEYRMKMINAVNAGIMAVINALASPVPWPVAAAFGIAAGTAAGVQIGLLAKNPPKPPKFANSGIVPGNKYSGDRVNALVDSGELILNRAHQDNIAGQLMSSGEVQATIVVMMDTREIARSTVNLVNDGFYTIKARAVQ